ncbi:MAG: Rrf2 family transcriptional regulator [Chloroflexi bacterium]|nr:Rrf2 family transcriptional regulator [Chloroflexota bacterium]
MHIPIKVDYAVRALVALAQQKGRGPVHATQVAKTMAMPEPYLNHILHTLSKHGFTTTLRGPLGGHMLAMEPKDINLSMVMSAFDESNALVGCLDDENACTLSDCCAQRNVWQTVEDAINTILERTTIADLVTPPRVAFVEAPTRAVGQP